MTEKFPNVNTKIHLEIPLLYTPAIKIIFLDRFERCLKIFESRNSTIRDVESLKDISGIFCRN